ncbi:MAG: hypothetical protein LBS06_00405 [Treponema sp.]|jgi:beta-mannosidase|nr:hypothetical protein [Treponema sp.]
MIDQLLHDNWKMRRIGEKKYLPAKVPGSVYHDLLVNKKMEDPFWRDNEDRAFALMEHDWEYVCVFRPDPAVLAGSRVLLHCDGLDTLADLYLNGALIGTANNMHRIWEFDVKKMLRGGENSLRIVFHSPVKFCRDARKKTRTDGAEQCLDGFPQLRKAHCMFGWDWGPRLPDAGIWRDIKLIGINTARIDGVYISQKHRKDSVDLGIQVTLDTRLKSGFSWTVSITDPKGRTTRYEKSPKKNHRQQTRTLVAPGLWPPASLPDTGNAFLQGQGA